MSKYMTESQSHHETQNSYLVPTFTLEDVLGVHADDRDLEHSSSDREWRDVILAQGSIDQHLGIFIAAIRGELQYPVSDTDSAVIRVTHRTTRIFEKAGIIFHEPATPLSLQTAEHTIVQLAAD